MNALVAGEGKLKPVLSGHVYYRLRPTGAAQADQPVGQQRRDLAPTLRRGHVLRGQMGDWAVAARRCALDSRSMHFV
jgi:hypothetical protein